MTRRSHRTNRSLLSAALLLIFTQIFGSGCRKRSDTDENSVPQLDAELHFLGEGAVVPSPTKRQLLAAIPSEVIQGFDPYYKRIKRYRALPLRAVLALGFPQQNLSRVELMLRAKDGYAVSLDSARLADNSGYLAVADLDVPAWEPIGPRLVDPAPYYVIWKGEGKQDITAYPRPWALYEIERARFETLYPHTLLPARDAAQPAAEYTAAQHGFSLFRDECIHCHAINQEGGRVGPDLNVPRSIVEYRPIPEIRAYIRNPQSFRYGAMPPHPQLTDADLDDLVAYFRIMSLHKHDPLAGPKTDSTSPAKAGDEVNK